MFMNRILTILIDFDHTLFDTEKFVKYLSENPEELNYADFLYPDAIAFIDYANSKGTTVLFSEGEPEFQKEKIRESGIEELFKGGVKILPSFSKMENLEEWKNKALVFVDDKPEVIDEAGKKGFLTIRVKRGKYADVETRKPAKYTVGSLAEIVEKDLLPKVRIHFLGIGGSGISGVALLSEKLGYEVSGCDLEVETAYRRNIVRGHSPGHVKDADLVVASPALLYQDKTNHEIQAAKKAGKLLTWQEFLGKYLADGKRTICIAGTHGKSTTTAMAGKVLADAGLDPLVALGARVPEWNGNARFGHGDYFIIEADEFNDNFLNYSPEIIILNNVEFDHPDYFKSEKEVFESFKKFVKKLTGEKILIVNKDSLGVKKLLSMIDQNEYKILEYSLTEENDLKLKIPGRHNLENAMGVIKLGQVLGINDTLVKKSLSDFKGIGRRLELIADLRGIKVYDDYAHHPTAIKTTLEGVRDLYPKAKILAVIEPHGYKRTKALLSKYKGVFAGVDGVFVGPIFKARDEVDMSVTPQKIADAADHKNIKAFNDFDEKDVGRVINSYDVVIVMGAGKSYLWAKEIANLLK